MFGKFTSLSSSVLIAPGYFISTHTCAKNKQYAEGSRVISKDVKFSSLDSKENGLVTVEQICLPATPPSWAAGPTQISMT
jgi:hypothetical protein